MVRDERDDGHRGEHDYELRESDQLPLPASRRFQRSSELHGHGHREPVPPL